MAVVVAGAGTRLWLERERAVRVARQTETLQRGISKARDALAAARGSAVGEREPWATLASARQHLAVLVEGEELDPGALAEARRLARSIDGRTWERVDGDSGTSVPSAAPLTLVCAAAEILAQVRGLNASAVVYEPGAMLHPARGAMYANA